MNNDLISREDIKDHIGELLLVYSGEELANAILNAIDNAPTVEKRPQGKWKVYPMPSASGFGLTIGIECPFCGYEVDEKYDFCVCGADMREGGAEE